MSKMNFWERLKKSISILLGWINDRRHRRTALMVAVRNLNEEKIRNLLHGENVNVLDRDNNTAVMYLLDKNFEENPKVKNIIDMLVSAGINLDNVNKNGETALIYVCKNKNFKMAEYLIKKGADVDVRNDENKKAIHYVDEDEGMRKLLIDNSREVANNIPKMPKDPFYESEPEIVNSCVDVEFEKKTLDKNVTYERKMREDREAWAEDINEKQKDIKLGLDEKEINDINGEWKEVDINKYELSKDSNETIDEGYYSDDKVYLDMSKKRNVRIDPLLMPDGFIEDWKSDKKDLEDNKFKLKEMKEEDISSVSGNNTKEKSKKDQGDILKNPWR